jgi:putative redox protein
MMKAYIKQISNIVLAGMGDSKHWIVMDSDEEFGGKSAACKPLELVLIGLGGCTGMDVISILKKMRSPIDDFEISIEAERAEEHPQVFTKIRLEYHFFGKSIDAQKIEKAIELSKTKYCSVSNMLKKSVSIEYAYRINPIRDWTR